jgi:hypothetical protein
MRKEDFSYWNLYYLLERRSRKEGNTDLMKSLLEMKVGPSPSDVRMIFP